MIAKLDAQFEERMTPFRNQRDLLLTVPGIGPLPSAAIISETGVDALGYFPNAQQLTSWSGLRPRQPRARTQAVPRDAPQRQSAPATRAGRVRLGGPHARALTPVLYRWHVGKFGRFRSPQAKKNAIIVVAHKLIVIIWHVLDTGRPYQEVGADYFTIRIDPEKETRRLATKLQALGHTVTPEPAA